jgi:hypothetical protein
MIHGLLGISPDPEALLRADLASVKRQILLRRTSSSSSSPLLGRLVEIQLCETDDERHGRRGTLFDMKFATGELLGGATVEIELRLLGGGDGYPLKTLGGLRVIGVAETIKRDADKRKSAADEYARQLRSDQWRPSLTERDLIDFFPSDDIAVELARCLLFKFRGDIEEAKIQYMTLRDENGGIALIEHRAIANATRFMDELTEDMDLAAKVYNVALSENGGAAFATLDAARSLQLATPSLLQPNTTQNLRTPLL